MGLYEKDFVAWSFDQAQALQNKDYARLDLKNLKEEIETLGRSERRAICSYLEKLMMHLLKMEIQPDYENTKSWERTIRNCRKQIKNILMENPCLKPEFIDFVNGEWESAKEMAAYDTFIPLRNIRKECYSKEEIMGVESWEEFLKELKR